MTTGAGPARPPSRLRVAVPRRLVVALVVIVIFAGGFATGRWGIGDGSTGNPSTSAPNAAPEPQDPDQSALSPLVLQQGDVASNVDVQLLRGGDAVSGQPTLDLCNGTFPSEARRTARLQVVALDAQGDGLLSTEAVLYSNAADAEQAFHELESVAASCPRTPVSSPVGGPTVTTRFNATPDRTWPDTPTVDRLAYSFTTTDQSGRTQSSIAVYLRHGRALMGVYFPQPDGPQTAVHGQTTIPAIVALFAGRLARVPTAR